MHDRVVALQLLSSYWLAVILPPLPVILCFSAIYNERISTQSGSLSPYFHHQGRKFGGYKILPKPCKDTSTPEKEAGVCMFNYECTQRAGTVVGSCMDGFLYGTCCKLPAGVSVSTVNVPETTYRPFSTSAASDRSTTLLKPHIEHAPEETYLLYKNGTVVQSVNSPDDFLLFSKQQTPLVSQTSPLPEMNEHRLPSANTDTPKVTNSISPSQILDMTMSFATKGGGNEPDRVSTLHSPKPYTTTSSREPFSPNFSSSKYSVVTTKISPFTPTRTTDYFGSKFTYGSSSHISTTPSAITNKNDIYDDEENLIRVPTLTVDSSHKYGSNSSINHILWLLNDTKTDPEPEETSTQPTQSFYTWLSVQNNPDKNSSPVYSTKPIHNTYYESKPSTSLPSTTVHHIPGPSFHVTPEVKITPKPQGSAADSAPTVIVLTSAHDGTTTSPKKPVYNYSTTASYNVSYHFPQTGSSSTKPLIKPAYSSSGDRPNYNSILITAKPSQTSFGSVRPQTTGYITKPALGDFPAKPSTSHLHTSFPVTSSPLPVKPLKTTTITSTVQSFTKIKQPSEPPPTTSSIPSIIQTTMVTTAKPVWSGSVNSEPIAKPTYHPSPIPTFSNLYPVVSTSGYVSVRPPSNNLQGITPQTVFEDNPTFSLYPGTNLLINTTESIFDFPPVRDPNVNLTATQHEKPLITSTTTFGDEDTEVEVTPQFAVDKTMEDKIHVFVEKIVQSLQGNFEDLEKVLIAGESTNNVTVSNGPTKKPASVTKRPTKKPTNVKPNTRPQQKPAITTLPATTYSTITKKPTKKPSLATPVVLFQPSSTSQATITIPNKKPIKVTASTTISISTTTSSTEAPSNPAEEEDEGLGTTTKQGAEEYSEYNRRDCGIRPLARKNGRIVGGKGSTFGEWPWQVLVREATWLGLFTKNKCGGVLITNKYVITAAHCQPGFLANLVAVFGEYDISGEVESKRSVSKNVRRVIVHRQYDPRTFENDIALLELESPIQFDSHIVPICMPEDDEDFTGRMATVTGWGRLKYGGGVPSVLQEVQVPVIENRVCQEMFQTAGHSKTILSSFLCAGYANGQRDSCEGDSGGPLMVERGDGHWILVATVSHGIKCAAPYLPGVYMRTTYYKPWLQTITGV